MRRFGMFVMGFGFATGGAAQQRVAAPAESLDVVIAGARIIDGTGRAGFLGEVGVRGGWIVRVAPPGGLRRAPARQRVLATGLVLAPGFVDVHSHTVDAIIEPERRWNEGVIRQGVTTVLGGPDGGYAPELMKRVIAAVGARCAFAITARRTPLWPT